MPFNFALLPQIKLWRVVSGLEAVRFYNGTYMLLVGLVLDRILKEWFISKLDRQMLFRKPDRGLALR